MMLNPPHTVKLFANHEDKSSMVYSNYYRCEMFSSAESKFHRYQVGGKEAAKRLQDKAH